MDSKKVVAASKALQKFVSTQSESKDAKSSLFDEADSEPVYLVVKAKRYFAEGKDLRPKLIKLPHSLYGAERPSICLFSRDPQRAYKDILIEGQDEKVVDRVIGLSKLKGKFKPYEARRNLKSQFDIFLCEKELASSLPSLLGKSFYSTAAKSPIAIKTHGDKTKDIKLEIVTREIEKVLTSTVAMKTASTLTSVHIGNTSFKPKQLAENAAAVFNYICENFVEEGQDAIRQVEIKTPHSISLPVYYTKQFFTETDIGTEEDNVEEKESVKRKKEEEHLDELLKEIVDEDEIKEYNREQRKKRKTGHKEASASADAASESTN